MLREIGLGAILLIILTAAVVIVALSQTTAFGPLAGNIGVNSETALSWGQALEGGQEATPEATAEAVVEPTGEMTEEPTAELTAEAEDATPEAEATEAE